jgi:hypothetical protein
MHFIEIEGEHYNTMHILSVKYANATTYQPTRLDKFEGVQVPAGPEQIVPAQLTIQLSTGKTETFSELKAETIWAMLIDEFPTLRESQA